MTKFVTAVMAVAFTVVFSAAVMADGWRIGNWEPPKAPMVKAVSLNADWGTAAVAPASPVAPAGCSGMVQHTHAAPAQRAGCSGRGGGWFFGRRIMANRQARFSARAQYSMATGHS